MSRYSTISVPEEVKAVLEKNEGDKDWGQYILELHEAVEEEKRRRAFERMREMLNEEV